MGDTESLRHRGILRLRVALPSAKAIAVRLVIEDVDLAELTMALRARFGGASPAGYLDGRTVLRDAVAEQLGCSTLEAEEIVDTLVARGFVRYLGDPSAALDDERGWSLGV
jgi:hypothetical protein